MRRPSRSSTSRPRDRQRGAPPPGHTTAAAALLPRWSMALPRASLPLGVGPSLAPPCLWASAPTWRLPAVGCRPLPGRLPASFNHFCPRPAAGPPATTIAQPPACPLLRQRQPTSTNQPTTTAGQQSQPSPRARLLRPTAVCTRSRAHGLNLALEFIYNSIYSSGSVGFRPDRSIAGWESSMI